MERGRVWAGDGNFFHTRYQRIGKIGNLGPLGSNREGAYNKISSSRGEPGEHLVARYRNEHDVEPGIFHCWGVALVDPFFEGLEVFVGTPMLDAIDDVILCL